MKALKQFEQLEKSFFNRWVSRDPLLATSLGLHRYDTQLPDGSLQEELDKIRLLRTFLKKVSQIPARLTADARRQAGGLPPSRAIDRELMHDLLRLWLFQKEELRFWEMVPQTCHVVGESLFQILSRSYAPLNERLKSIYRRLLKLPRYIEQSKSKLRVPVKLYLEIELETLSRLPPFFNTLKNVAMETLPVRAFNEFCQALENLEEALEDYSNWLIVDLLPISQETAVVGEEKFTKLLKLRGIEATPRQLMQFGRRELAALRRKLRQMGHHMKRRATMEDLYAFIKSKHPAHFNEVLKFVQESVQKARRFVERAHFATLPANEALYVVDTPSFLRHLIPFGAYSSPAKFEKKHEGYYYVTPPDAEGHRLKEHNYASLANMTIHEGYPGHHLQLTWAMRNPSLIRTFAHATETIEGWAHYCEERAKELGYENNTPAQFILTLDLLWRAVRILIDVQLHTGKMSGGEAVNFLIDETGMEQSAAEAEVRRYLISPTQPLSYLWGKEKIKELKQYVRKKMNARFDERFFHDTFMQAGSLPLYLMRKEFDWKIEEALQQKPQPAKPNQQKQEPAPSKPHRPKQIRPKTTRPRRARQKQISRKRNRK